MRKLEMHFFYLSIICIGAFLLNIGCSSPPKGIVVNNVPIPLHKDTIVPPPRPVSAPKELEEEKYSMTVLFFENSDGPQTERGNNGQIVSVELPDGSSEKLVDHYAIYDFDDKVRVQGGTSHFPTTDDWIKLKKHLLSGDRIYAFGEATQGFVIIRDNNLYCLAFRNN